MTSTTTGARARTSRTIGITAGLIGWLFLVEITSGILQGYYVPLISDIVKHLGIHDADYNWFEAAQLLLSALVVPVLAKLGDMFGHKRILLVSTVVTALASWGIAFAGSFSTYLIAFALQGFYTVWLPLEIALIFDRGRRTGTAASRTRRAAGLLVVALEVGAIVGALAAGRLFSAFGQNVQLTLIVPAIAVSLVFFAIWFGVPESEPMPGKRRLDIVGFTMLTLSLLLITSGLTFLRINGPGAVWVWALIVIGVAAIVPFVRYELRQDDPAIDIRVFRQPNMWPVQLTAGLIGISLLGAQAPLSTFAGTDPKNGYGLGLDASDRSTLIGVYLVSMIVGALLFPLVSKWAKPRVALIGASFLVAIGYLLFLPFHQETWQVIMNMAIAGIGSGALVGALPAAAAAAAPRGQTGIAAALTNTTKTIGGSFASAVFGVVLLTGATAVTATAASLFGYMLVWTICGLGALVAAVLLFFVPKLAFADALPEEGVVEVAAPGA
ncbi:MFS transporter [Diaminobutyricibacter tongyongensis]|uniref:MFS transporter n=1 Tax=Leifsonia tongyongensis TaxID=1268043 RepID=A0A6L9Y0V4_9MICO|nr:MFS transporter [Diaminobutyricibacter tongyongensis]NEN07322.1 MFS transporter [Diaminobutyricibacter tongyongensis]